MIAARLDLMAFHSNKQTKRADATSATPAQPALGYLLTSAHTLRMGFNLRPFVKDIYQNFHKVISHHSKENPLRVSLHMRRADSCYHHHSGYTTNASAPDSIPQVSGKRMCYNTSVYMNGLRRVQRLSERPLDELAFSRFFS